MSVVPASGNFGDVFSAWVGSGATALIDLTGAAGERSIDYDRLDENCRAVARGLAAAGLGPGDRVALLAGNSIEFLEIYYGAMRAGCIVLPVNVKLPRHTLDRVLGIGEARLIFADRATRDLCPAGMRKVVLDGDGEDGYAAFRDPGPFESHRPAPDEIAYQPYTSGTTGVPKGILTSHEAAFSGLVARTYPGWVPDPTLRAIVAHPLYHKNAMLAVKNAFLNGGALVLLERFDVERYLAAIERYGVTHLQTVPTMMALIVARQDTLDAFDLSSVRFILIGSAPLTEKLLGQVRAAFPGAYVRNGYGLSEAGVVIFGDRPDKPTPPMSIGAVMPDSEVKLVGGPSADEGEMYVRTPRMMTGYHNLPELTAERMTDDGWIRSGDVLRRDGDGFYYFVGRTDDMFTVGGNNLYPATVERTLLRHPAVHQVAVVAVADEVRGHVPHAFVVLAPGAQAAEDEIKAFAIDNAPAYQHPRRVYFVDSLPWAGTNKVDYRLLRERAAAVGAAPEPPSAA